MKTLYSAKDIQNFVQKLGSEIKNYYKSPEGEDIVALVILKGATFFAVDLLRELQYPKIRIEFIRVSSYHGEESTGKIRLHYPLEAELKGKNILVIDEIIDTGFTLKYLNEYLKSFQPADIKYACLLDKKVCRKSDFHAEFVGKEIPNQFVIGYGLDYNEDYRTLPEIKIFES